MACKEDEEQWRRGSEEELLGRALPSPRLTFTAHAHASCILVKHRFSAPRNPSAARCPGETEK